MSSGNTYGLASISNEPSTAVAPDFVPDLPGIYAAQLVVSDPFEDSAPDTVTVTVISGEDCAEMMLAESLEFVEDLPMGNVTKKGNQNAQTRFVSLAITELQAGDLDEALNKIGKAIERTDGCVLRGGPDGTVLDGIGLQTARTRASSTACRGRRSSGTRHPLRARQPAGSRRLGWDRRKVRADFSAIAG